MRKHIWLTALVAMFLAATLSWADLGFAQGRGQGRGAAVQGQRAGRGTGNPATCPYYTGAQTCPVSGGGCNPIQTRARKRYRQSAPQAPASTPQTSNPSTQSGN